VTVTRIGCCSRLNAGKHARWPSSRPVGSCAVADVGPLRLDWAPQNVSERRGSALRLVNPACTSQVIPGTSLLGRRVGDRLHCPTAGSCGTQTTPLRSTSWTEMPIPTSARTSRIGGSGGSSRNGLIATGPDCRTRTPTPQTPAGVESEISIHDQP
jgi:hypothetical protein